MEIHVNVYTLYMYMYMYTVHLHSIIFHFSLHVPVHAYNVCIHVRLYRSSSLFQQADEFGISGTPLFPSVATVKTEDGERVEEGEREDDKEGEEREGEGVQATDEEPGPSGIAAEAQE